MGKVLLYIAISLVVVLGDAENGRPFRSFKAPKETIVHYEVVLPRITYRDSEQAYPRLLRVNIPTHMTNYSLVLELNEQLVPPGFTSLYYDDKGQEVVSKGHVNCFYQGRVEGHPDWRATMTTCHGLQGFFGDTNNENSFFHIEPLGEEYDGSTEQPHAFYLDSEYKDRKGNCGSDHSHLSNSRAEWPKIEHHHRHGRLRRQSTTRIVEWIVVNDDRQFTSNGRNLTTTVLRALALANEVDALYKQLMIRVVLIGSITWTKGDMFKVPSNASDLLDAFQRYRPSISTPHDSAMLLTGIDIDGDTAGYAYIRTMCSDTHSVGVTQDGGLSLSAVASIAAHELGHNFNMNHDDTSRGCTCADGDQGCIMAAFLSGPPTRWSSCSVSDLNIGYNNYSTDTCLFNQPTTSVGDPVCGNGIREGDEICDCGSAQECTDPCCDAATCQLASGAQCSAGPCCTSTCQFVSYGTECRAALGECDIAEYCLGDSSECPSNEHLLDGTTCNSNTSYCYSGMCPTHDAQCQRAFGSNKADDMCYDRVNVLGSEFGNCGHSSTNFLACSASNVQCGQLQCMTGELNSSLRGMVRDLTFTIQSNIICRSFTTQPSSSEDTPSPGLVEDGTRCGDAMVCLSQRCVLVSQISTAPCDLASNGLVCSGNGVCNNRRTCSCNVGFTGTSCQSAYSSGSDNSGGNNAGLIAGAIIGTLIGLALLIGLIIGIVVLVKFMSRKKYSPPTQSNVSVKTTPGTSQRYGKASPGASPSINVVRPGASYSKRNPTPSAPPKSVVANKNYSHPPPRPAPPPKPGAPSKPAPPVNRPPPPRPAPPAQQHSTSPPVKPPRPPAHKPQIALKPTKPPRQWPPSS